MSTSVHDHERDRPIERAPSATVSVHELRCTCGSLAARLVDGKVEFKCRRCQRLGVLDLSGAGGDGRLEICWLGEDTGGHGRRR
jgi:hypothetical protein